MDKVDESEMIKKLTCTLGVFEHENRSLKEQMKSLREKLAVSTGKNYALMDVVDRIVDKLVDKSVDNS